MSLLVLKSHLNQEAQFNLLHIVDDVLIKPEARVADICFDHISHWHNYAIIPKKAKTV